MMRNTWLCVCGTLTLFRAMNHYLVFGADNQDTK